MSNGTLLSPCVQDSGLICTKRHFIFVVQKLNIIIDLKKVGSRKTSSQERGVYGSSAACLWLRFDFNDWKENTDSKYFMTLLRQLKKIQKSTPEISDSMHHVHPTSRSRRKSVRSQWKNFLKEVDVLWQEKMLIWVSGYLLSYRYGILIHYYL